MTPEHRRYDVAELSWSLVRSTLAEELQLSEEAVAEIEVSIVFPSAYICGCELTSVKRDMETKMDTELEEFFIIERDSGEPSSYGTLTHPAVLREISLELEEQLKTFLKLLKKRDAKRKRSDFVYNTILEKVLKARLAQYPTSIEHDQGLLSRDDLGKRHRMAVEVRLGEKHLLQEALALVHVDGSTAHEHANGGQVGKKVKRTS